MVYEQMSIGWLSKNTIDRHRPVFLAMQWGLFLIGAIFWIDASFNSQGFNLAVFGSFAYAIPPRYGQLLLWHAARFPSSVC